MQGIWIQETLSYHVRRPRSKKEVREVVAAEPQRVIVEATSMFGNEPEGPANELENGTTVSFVGPDPYARRNFYGQIIKTTDGRLVVK